MISCNDREEIHLASHLQSPACELHYLDTLQPFSCPSIGILSTKKSKNTHSWKREECPVLFMSELLPQAAELEYLAVLLMTEKRLEQETDAQIGAASALMRILKERMIDITILSYGHKLWVLTKNMRS